MEISVDVWVRGTDFATTALITEIATEPSAWTEMDVSTVLKQMLLALYRARNPGDEVDREVFLRGFNWIVNPFEDAGVVIAIEMQTGAAVAGPFQIDKGELEGMITRAIAANTSAEKDRAVH